MIKPHQLSSNQINTYLIFTLILDKKLQILSREKTLVTQNYLSCYALASGNVESMYVYQDGAGLTFPRYTNTNDTI